VSCAACSGHYISYCQVSLLGETHYGISVDQTPVVTKQSIAPIAVPFALLVASAIAIIVIIIIKNKKKQNSYKKPVAINRSLVSKSNSRESSKLLSANGTSTTTPNKRGSAQFNVD